jgi:hypothetical protein
MTESAIDTASPALTAGPVAVGLTVISMPTRGGVINCAICLVGQNQPSNHGCCGRPSSECQAPIVLAERRIFGA